MKFRMRMYISSEAFIMKKNSATILMLLMSVSSSFSQIPVKKYRAEIENLKSEKQLNDYWNRLYKIDQEVLVNTSDLKTTDSISVSNMVRTALIFDIHGMNAYNPNGLLPILNLSHNYIGQSQLVYWEIIEKCAEIGGTIKSFGGKYPAYQLESVSLTFYNYSLINQETKYPNLVKKLSKLKTVDIVDELLKSLEYQDELRKLSEVAVLNSWHLQSLKNRNDEGKFSIVKMSDDNVYLKKHGRIQKLELIKTKDKSKIFRIENEPFGWNYIYGNDGSLTLIDNDKNELIEYISVK